MKRLARLAFVALLASACGGKVVVDAPDEGSGGTTSASSTTTTTSTSGGPDPCVEACAALGAKGCAGADCVDRCEAVPSTCSATANLLLACLRDQAAAAASCIVDACITQREALMTCIVGTSCESPNVGPGNPGLLVGKGICGGMHEHAAVCDEGGHCDCVFDVDSLGTCQETGPFLADIGAGCCGSIFPQGG